MEVRFKGKVIEIPDTIPCTKDDGVMAYVRLKRAYVCFTVPECKNTIKLSDYLKNNNVDKERNF